MRAVLASLYAIILASVVASCARMGQPDGGWYDEVPPRVVGATPSERATGVTDRRITIRFSEYIKLDNPSENVVICPPQLEQPDIKTMGKAIRIDLKDSLKENTTYTIDFSDAITDNNEGNPMGNYTYVFSTGQQIDTLEVAGYVLDAETLEPVKGSLVGLYSNLADSAFTTLAMQRTGRTDDTGHFIIRGVAPGSYRIVSLADADGDFKLSQRGERLSFSHDIITPSSKPDTRQDTTWLDSLHIADIKRIPYTHYLPDDICLRSFEQQLTDRYLIKSERPAPERFILYFSTPADTLPRLRPLNFPDTTRLVAEATERHDTITYWLPDTLLANQDTLDVELTYIMTDSLGQLVAQTDTLSLLSKIPYAKRLRTRLEELDKWEKKAEKARKKGREPEKRPYLPVLTPKFSVPAKMSPDKNVLLSFDTPLATLDTAAIHLYSKIDTLWYRAPVAVTPSPDVPRSYVIQGEWRPGVEYSLEVDSAAFRDIYGNVAGPQKQGVKIASNDEFSSLFVNIRGLDNDSAQIIVDVIDKSEKIVKRAVARDKTAEFYYLPAGTYYLRCIVDANHNNRWDTGDYTLDRQPEEVYYDPEEVECKEKWDLTHDFNVRSRPLYLQKPREMVKQKGEKKRTVKQLNSKRAEEMKIPYDRDKVNALF